MTWSSIRHNAILFIPALTGFLEYLIAVNMPVSYPIFYERYFSLFFTLLACAILASLRITADKRGQLALKPGKLPPSYYYSYLSPHQSLIDCQDALANDKFVQFDMATQLNTLGLKPGDKVANIGQAGMLYDWAHLAKAKIVMDIPDSKQFFLLPLARRKDLFNIIKEYNVKMLVYMAEPISKQSKMLAAFNHQNFLQRMGIEPKNENQPLDEIKTPTGEGWHKLNNLNCWVYLIN